MRSVLRRLCGLAVAWLVMAGAAAAQDNSIAAAEQAEQRFVAALVGNIEALQTLLADDFIYLTTAGSVIGKAALLAHLRSGATVVRGIERQAVQRVVREGLVVTTGILRVQVLHEGGEQDIRSRYLHVWAPGADAAAGWLLVARQATELRAADRR